MINEKFLVSFGDSKFPISQLKCNEKKILKPTGIVFLYFIAYKTIF